MKNFVFFIEIIIVLIIGGLVTFEYMKNKENSDDRNNRFNVRNNDFTQLDLVGEISDISGCTITLKIIDMKRPDDRNRELSENIDITSDTIPTFRHTEYTGEMRDIILPDGVKITNRLKEEVNIKDLKIGDVIGIVYKEDKVSIESIRIINLKIAPKDINIPK